MEVRPIWGLLRMLLRSVLPRQWHLVVCAGPEERSSAAAEVVAGVGVDVASADCLRLLVPTDRFSAEREKKVDDTLARLRAAMPGRLQVREMELFGTIEPLDEIVTGWVSAGRQHILLDVSTMPKKIFFPLLRLAIRSRAFATLIAIYSRPQKYAEQPLAEDPDPPLPLPLFTPAQAPPHATGGIVALGLEVLGIEDLLADGGGPNSIHVLFPIPTNPDESSRTWMFMQRLYSAAPNRFTPPRHLSPLDYGEAYSYIRSLTDSFQGHWWLAPFGPKPVSVAMAVAAIQHDWPAYYSQPTVYNPAYSVGVGREGRDLAVYGYLLVSQGQLQA